MCAISFRRLSFKTVLFFLITSSMLLHQGCSKPYQTVRLVNPSTAPVKGSSGMCVKVNGIVLGDIPLNSKVSLYKTSSLNYSIVMRTIGKTQPMMMQLVNESRGFEFDCLSFGKYVFVIPTTSFSGAVGSPLPYEFDCKNVSLEIAFQGGDSTYSVGAFSIINTSKKNDSACMENPIFCENKKGRLYKNCSFELK